MAVLGDDELIGILIAARDEHVRRLHSISGHVAGLVVAVSVTLFVGAIHGIDALSDLDLTSDAGWLLLTGACAFAASTLFISLALIHHTRARSAAASHIEGAVARLISGEERELVLADLGTALAPLLDSSKRARPGSYLATELNGRRLGLTVYQKAFLGCVLLLIASLATGLGIIAGYAPEAAEDAEADVAAQESNVRVRISSESSDQISGGFEWAGSGHAGALVSAPSLSSDSSESLPSSGSRRIGERGPNHASRPPTGPLGGRRSPGERPLAGGSQAPLERARDEQRAARRGRVPRARVACGVV
jgi:hypothetical protein